MESDFYTFLPRIFHGATQKNITACGGKLKKLLTTDFSQNYTELLSRLRRKNKI